MCYRVRAPLSLAFTVFADAMRNSDKAQLVHGRTEGECGLRRGGWSRGDVRRRGVDRLWPCRPVEDAVLAGFGQSCFGIVLMG
ncbi:hypothetical protein LX32DRAFT_156817 [Colletotrichum zoysiae]|uniref:Uncharacterized protein n=1 Tax=Colletotrichum zoysiae TaxID=1216348 RepID=A0AAD9M5R7_9PEZI|nr:hypothetical protein LX32DRAFT_156817 [Colletotrichum zoysiae]